MLADAGAEGGAKGVGAIVNGAAYMSGAQE